MRKPQSLTFPDGSSPRAVPARRHQTLDRALAETSSRGHRARDEPATMKFVSSGNNNRGTATNRVQEPRRRIECTRKSLSVLRSVPAPARRGALGLATMPTRRSCRRRLAAGEGTNLAQAPRQRTARARGEPAGLAHVPPWLPSCACRSGRRCRGQGDESRTETIGWGGALLLL